MLVPMIGRANAPDIVTISLAAAVILYPPICLVV